MMRIVPSRKQEKMKFLQLQLEKEQEKKSQIPLNFRVLSLLF
jgi:hypothetical protein